MDISAIVAVDKNNAIGGYGSLAWHIPEDLKRFRLLTTDHHIIMGRKTYESIGKPLPNRTNIIVSRNPDYKVKGCTVVNSIEDAYTIAKEANEEELFIIGGGELYEATKDDWNWLYITKVDTILQNPDAYFPEIDYIKWDCVYDSGGNKTANDIHDYVFKNYRKSQDVSIEKGTIGGFGESTIVDVLEKRLGEVSRNRRRRVLKLIGTFNTYIIKAKKTDDKLFRNYIGRLILEDYRRKINGSIDEYLKSYLLNYIKAKFNYELHNIH